MFDQLNPFFATQIDLLAEISIPPRIMSDVDGALKSKQMKTQVDEYLKVNDNCRRCHLFYGLTNSHSCISLM